MKKVLCFFMFAVMLLASLGLWARPVSVDQAHRVAESFLRGVGCKNASSLVNRSAELPFHQFYLFTAEQGGFVFVSADDCVLPILGYSSSNIFDVKGMPDHVADWLGGYEEQIAFFVRQDERRRSSGLQCGEESSNIVAQQWKLLLAGEMMEPTNTNSVSPLLTTTWNQSPYYNNLCPEDNGHYSGHAVAGCTAIATAQVMKYWNYPSVGYGSMTYYHDAYGSLSANFGNTTYQWNSMPNALSSSSTSSQINAVATLVYHVGVAVNMDYGPDGSGAQTISSGDPVQPSAENALKNNFKYSSTLHSIRRSDYAPEVFANILCTELDNSRPIIFSGRDIDAGHAFVLDGYNYYGDFHVNWGWGGYCDGYYTMGALNPSTGGTGGNTSGTYNINNSAIIGVQPNYSFSTTGTTSVSVTSTPSSYGWTTGSGYYGFGDTVYISAYANEGCRFSQWNDGYRCNPRGFLAMGGNYSFTANFEHLSGDTLGYVSSNTMLSSLGTGSTSSNVSWGIRLPASVLTSGHDLKKVQMYVAYAGTYTTNIYVGSPSSTPVASQTFTATTADEDTWKTIALITPVTVTGSQDIYITFENTGVAYPAALSYDCGNDDGLLWGSSFGSIHSSWNYTFMIRGIFGSSIPTGDTLSYCEDNPYESNIGAGGSIYWGIKIPGSWQAGHTYLSSVQLYVVNPGTYDLILAQGGTNAPSTTVPIQSVSFGSNDVYQWHSIPVATTYMLDSSQPLWVVFHNTDATYPAAACIPNPDSNSSWCSTNGTIWGSLYTLSGGSLDRSWMIKCIVSNTLPEPNVTISGDTYFQTFSSKTFSAQSNRANATYAWTLPGATPSYATGATVTAYWSQAGIYDVVVAATSGGVTVRDTLQVEVYDCAPQSVPWAEYFNNATNNCWTYIGYQPSSSSAGIQYDNWTIYNGGLVSFTSASSTGTVSRWVFLPAIHLTDATICQLKFFYSIYADQSSPYLGVYVASAPTPASARLLRSYNISTLGNYQLDSISLIDYVGQTVYLAFCDSSSYNYNCDNEIFLDNIQVEETSECLPFSTPFSCGFESVTDLGCWNFVDADGDGYGWTTTNIDEGVNFEGRNGGTAIGSNSYNITSSDLTPDNWLISPAITLPSGTTPVLAWYDKSYSASYGDEFYAVYISTMGNNPANFTTMLYSGTSAGTWACHYADLSAYVGQTVYIAFRHFNCTDQWALLLDDVTLDNNTPQYYTVTANANNSSYGSVTGGGAYLEGTQVTLYATASTDCRFAYWADGNADNPRTFSVTGNVSHTAYFEHLSGDTLRYDNGIYLNNLGTGGSMYWAVRFNPTVMLGYSSLQKVQFPDVASGSYTIRIHRGGTSAPGALVTSKTVSLTGSYEWVTIDLNNPVSLNEIDPIWIVMEYSGTGYPAAYATSSGNTNGGWVSLDGSTWSDISEYGYINTWMLRGIMQATYTITAVANNPSYGTVTGGGDYPMGYQVSLSATPYSGYRFVQWQDGNTNATRTVTVSGNATYTAYFTPTADSCLAITSFPYTMGFEATDDLSCWNFVDADDDGYGWDYNTFSNSGQSHMGSGVIGSASFVNDIGALTPDNWLITPKMHLPANARFNLSWWVGAVDANYCAENYTVYVSTTGNQPANFTTILFNGIVESASYVQKNVDLSAYAGQNIYIAFRHHNITDMYWMLIDDITIDIDTNNCIPVSNVVASNVTGNSATISWTAGDPSQNNFVVAYDTGTDPSQMTTTNSSSTTINLTGLAGSTTYNVFVKVQCDANNASVWNSVSFTTPRVWGDTIFYDDGIFASSIGTGSPVDIYWGIKVNAEDLIGRAELTDVMLYVESPGTYDLTVYQGGAYAPQTAMVTQSITCTTDTAQWKTIHLTNPMAINATQPLWITFHNDDLAYPAAGSSYTGDPNGSFISLNGSNWNVLSSYGLAYSWMIRAITSATSTQQYDVTISCMGTGSGEVKRTDSPESNLCGTVDRVYDGFVASYKFLPSQGSELAHLYVNNIDRINEVQTSSSASSSSYSLWSFTPTGNTTIYSVFDLRNFTVTAASSNPAQGSVTGSGNYPYGSSVVLTAQPVNGHHFVRWSITTAGGTTTSLQNPYVGTITGDMSATAYFAADTYQITVTANDLTRGVVTGSGEYLYLETVTATATPYSGYYFAGWSNGTSYNPYTFPATQDLVLQAIFLPESDTSTYVVSAVANNPVWGSVSGGGRYAIGTTVTLAATPYSGYLFDNWSDGSTENPRTIVVTGDMNFVAIFSDANPSYNVIATANDSTMGSVTGAGTYASGQQATITALPSEGHHFVYWEISEGSLGDSYTSTLNPYIFTVEEVMEFRAIFAIDTFEIMVSPNDPLRGTVSGSGQYTYMETVTATATPYSGYYFAGWNNGSTQNPYMFLATNNETLVALFLPDGDTSTYLITVSVNDSTMGEVSGGGTYQLGEMVSLSATAYEGYRFDNWSDGSTENPRSVIVTEDKTYVAYFSSTTGIGDVRSVSVVLYPNPTTGKVHVDADEVERIKVYDQVGRLVSIYEHTNEADLSGIVPGIYTLHIQMPLGDVIKKVIKVDF